MPEVAIIGAGMAGLAAASRLASGGIAVTVFEPAKQLGGRARGIEYKDMMLDNGQHIMLGAYRETLALLAQAGVDASLAFLRMPLQLHMQDIQSKQAIALQACNWLPAPLHILGGFLTAQGLSFGSKLAALRFMVWAQLQRFRLKQDMPLADLLVQCKQTPQLTTAIWEPLCLAALNTPISEASAQVFLNVLRDSFAHKKSDSDMLLPRADLSTLLAQPLANWLCGQGAKFVRQSVKKVESSESGFTVSTDTQTHTFSHVIFACGPHQLKRTELPGAIANSLPAFEYQPITTVYLQFDKNLQFDKHLQLPRPMTGLVNSVSQWVLDRGLMYGQQGLLAVVISADKVASDMPNDTLVEQVLAELKQAFPNMGAPLWHKVITERFATFACKPGLARPAGHTLVPGLFLSGDYIENGYPATIEGAVRNGLSAADMLQRLL